MTKEINQIVLNHTIELLERYETKLNIIKCQSEQNPGTEKELSDYQLKLLEIDIQEIQQNLQILKNL